MAASRLPMRRTVFALFAIAACTAPIVAAQQPDFSNFGNFGGGLAAGCVGDVMKLLTKAPDAWEVFDVVGDCIAAVMSITGMAFVHAATSQRRTASFLVSGALIASGLGIGLVTL